MKPQLNKTIQLVLMMIGTMFILPACDKVDPYVVPPSATLTIRNPKSEFFLSSFKNEKESSPLSDVSHWISPTDLKDVIIQAGASQPYKNISSPR